MRVPVKTQASYKLGEFSSKNHFPFHYYESKISSFLDFETFPPFFKSCANFQLVKEATSAHADVIKMGFDSYTSTSNSIMSFYFKLGMKDCGRNLFNEMAWKDSVSWNALIHGSLSQGDSQFGLGLLIEAKSCGFVPNLSTLVLVLQACWKLKASEKGQCFHGFIVKSGFTAGISVQNSLLSFYGKSKDVESAQKMFDEMPERDVISWSSLISGYAQTGSAVTALKLFRNMSVKNGVEIDGLVLVSVLQACSFVGYINYGSSVHGHVIQRGFEADLFISNSLIDMYSKCFHMSSAYMVFTQMNQTNLVSWNSILSGLVENEKHMEALWFFESMKKAGVEGDTYTAVILLQASKILGLEVFCRSIHSVIIRNLFELNNFVLNSLLDAYAKCGLMELALRLFGQMPDRDVISWSTMISGFSRIDEPRRAVAFFVQMRRGRELPNSITLLSLLEACSALADLELSKCVHGVAAKNGLSDDSSVATALLDTYAKCGSLDSSKRIFDGMAEKNFLSWNAMIGAFGMNGCAREALAALEEMAVQNVKPNGVTMLSVLSACSHGGLVEEGLLLFQRMSEDLYIKPNLEHYSCFVDMLARAGDLKGGFEVIKRMSEEGLEVGPAAYAALLSASKRDFRCEIGRNVASHVVELEPLSSAGCVLSSSLYSKAGLRDEKARLRLLMRERGVKVVSGYSLVHVGKHAIPRRGRGRGRGRGVSYSSSLAGIGYAAAATSGHPGGMLRLRATVRGMEGSVRAHEMQSGEGVERNQAVGGGGREPRGRRKWRRRTGEEMAAAAAATGDYACRECARVFGTRQALGGHKASHRGVMGCSAKAKETAAAAAEVREGGDGSAFVCHVCGRQFAAYHGMRVHRQRHGEERGFMVDLNLPPPPEVEEEEEEKKFVNNL